MKPFLVFENGTTYTKEQFDNKANVYAEELRSAGYDKTCRIGVYSNIENIFKLYLRAAEHRRCEINIIRKP